MKLIHYTIRNLSVPLLIIMFTWACVFYFLVLHEVNDETNDTLQNYKEIIIKQALADSTFLKDDVNIMNSYYIREIPENEANLAKDIFYDSTKYIEIEDEDEPIRVLKTNFMTSNGKFYELKIEISTLEKEDLTETIFWGIIFLYVLLLCCLLIVIHFVFKKSFRPLYTMLEWLRHYNPARPIKPLDNDTSVEEFDTLNKAFKEAAERGISLYNQQKQFVENASHELQTPLAVCMNRLELLSENPACTEELLSEIEGIHNYLHHISKLNKSLLLLSRIDNKQFPDTQNISISKIVKNVLEQFSEIYEEKHIRSYFMNETPLSVTMNTALAEALVTNLIKNAFIHNIREGEIFIHTTENQLIIENTSDCTELNKEKLFQRFGKQNNRPNTNGLGLAIVKSITTLYNIDISYSYNGKHRFVLTFYI